MTGRKTPAHAAVGAGADLVMPGPDLSPKAVADQLNAALRATLKNPEFLKRQDALGAVVVTDARMNPADHKKFVAAEKALRQGDTVRWARLMEEAEALVQDALEAAQGDGS